MNMQNYYLVFYAVYLLGIPDWGCKVQYGSEIDGLLLWTSIYSSDL